MQIQSSAAQSVPARESQMRTKRTAGAVAAFAAAVLAILFLAVIVMTPAKARKQVSHAPAEQTSIVRFELIG
jgi:hypothetical protein